MTSDKYLHTTVQFDSQWFPCMISKYIAIALFFRIIIILFLLPHLEHSLGFYNGQGQLQVAEVVFHWDCAAFVICPWTLWPFPQILLFSMYMQWFKNGKEYDLRRLIIIGTAAGREIIFNDFFLCSIVEKNPLFYAIRFVTVPIKIFFPKANAIFRSQQIKFLFHICVLIIIRLQNWFYPFSQIYMWSSIWKKQIHLISPYLFWPLFSKIHFHSWKRLKKKKRKEFSQVWASHIALAIC